MGNITVRVWLAKHVNGQDSCYLISFNACCTYIKI